mgnify:CR=1 FL=1
MPCARIRLQTFYRTPSLSSFQSICLPRPFSSRESSASISFKRLASDTLMPPNLLHHRQEEASLERPRWAGHLEPQTGFQLTGQATDLSVGNPRLHVRPPPDVGLNSKPPCSSNAAIRRAAAKHGDLRPSTLHRQPAQRMDGQASTVRRAYQS